MKRFAAAALNMLCLAGCVTAPSTSPPAAETWLTTADETQKLSRQPSQPAAGPASGDEALTIDTSQHFQKVHGFGAAMTDASAQLLSELPRDKRKSLMAELFGRSNSGLLLVRRVSPADASRCESDLSPADARRIKVF